MKRAQNICVLLDGPVYNDARVIKTILSLSKIGAVYLFHVADQEESCPQITSSNIHVVTLSKPQDSFTNKIIRHTFFTREFNFLIDVVLNLKIEFDIIFANDLPTLYPAVKLKERLNAKLVYDSHEIYTGTINQFFTSGNNALKNLLFRSTISIMTYIGKREERQLLSSVDRFITTSTSFRDYFKKEYDLKDISIVMNCPPLNEDENEKVDFREMYSWSEADIILIFQGVFNPGRALFTLLKTMEFLDEQYKLILVGSGPLEKGLKDFVQNNNLDSKIKFIDKVPPNELLKYTRGADMGINLQEPINISKELASANKIFEYMHALIPVVASNVPENVLIVEENKLGYIVENNEESIAEGVYAISKHDKYYYVEKCKKARRVYNWQNQEKVLLETLKSLDN